MENHHHQHHAATETDPAAMAAVERATATLPEPLAGRVEIRELPPGALL